MAHQQWVKVNWDTLLKSSVPVMAIVDRLVPLGVYDPREYEYQTIDKEPTTYGKMHLLLKSLLNKSASHVGLFKEALNHLYPHVVAKCIDKVGSPPDALNKLDTLARTYYQHNLNIRPLTWIAGSQQVKASTYFLNLAMVEKSEAESMMSDIAATSAVEIERQDYLYAQPVEQNLVSLGSLFFQFCKEQKDKSDSLTCTERTRSTVAETFQETVPTLADNGSASCGVGEEENSLLGTVISAQRVGIYGGAGCGKTSCLMKAASMYAGGELWQGARTFLLWRLRDSNVQKADSLKQLLVQLHLDLTEEECEMFAEILHSSKGTGVILALDGVDELDAQKNGFIWCLLDGSALPKACVLATSRSCSTAKTYFDKYEANLELLGFTEEQTDQFIEQHLGDLPQAATNLKQVLLDEPTLASLMLVPLLATMVCQIFRLTSENLPKTRTALYSKLLVLALQRSVDKRDGRVALSADEREDAMMVSDVHELRGKAFTFVKELSHLAFLAHRDRKAVFDGRYVRATAGCSHDALRLGLLSSYNVEQGTVVLPQYSFQHLTVQEFLVAFRLVMHATTVDELQVQISALLSLQEEALEEKLSAMLSAKQNHVVLQFAAGLVAPHLRPQLFMFLNEWLHTGYDRHSQQSRSRLRLCLQCAKEACSGDLSDFPLTLKLPETVRLNHVTAADLTQLSLALGKSQHITYLELLLDGAKEDSARKKVSRLRMQTRKAMTRLMVAISTNQTLCTLILNGPKYSVFEEEGFQALSKTVEKNSLMVLSVVRCEIENTLFHALSSALRQNTQLKSLWLRDNSLDDNSVRMLAEDLKDNTTLQRLHLDANNYGQESRDHLRQQLKHIRHVVV